MYENGNPTDLGAQASEVAAKELERRRATKLERDDIKWFMSHQSGRRTMWRLLEFTGVYKSSYTGEGPGTFFKEGTRNVGLFLMGQILEHCPDEYNKMVKEREPDDNRGLEGLV